MKEEKQEDKKNLEKAEDKVKFQWADHEYVTTKAGRDLILQVLAPDKKRRRLEKLEAKLEVEQESEQSTILRDIRPEDICEFIFDRLVIWKNPEIIKSNIVKILWQLKHEKLDRLDDCFNVD